MQFFIADYGMICLTKNIDIVINSESAEMIKSSSGYLYKALVNDYSNKYMQPFFMKIAKGHTKFFKHDGEEFAYVLKGRRQNDR